jgi:hypothetical protein
MLDIAGCVAFDCGRAGTGAAAPARGAAAGAGVAGAAVIPGIESADMPGIESAVAGL